MDQAYIRRKDSLWQEISASKIAFADSAGRKKRESIKIGTPFAITYTDR